MKGSDIVESLIKPLVANPNVTASVNSQVTELDGSVGFFKAKIRSKPRFVDAKCTLCGECFRVCPVDVPNEYEFGISTRKAIYLPFKEAYPPIAVIDPETCTRCGECVKVCQPHAIDLNEKAHDLEAIAGGVILATGFSPYEPPEGEYGYGRSKKVLTLFQLERLLDKEDPPEEN